MIQNYELLYIIPLSYTEKKVPSIVEALDSTIKKYGGVLAEGGECLKKKLAYPVKQIRQGFFVNREFAIERTDIKKIHSELTLNSEVLRFQIIKKKPGAYEPIHVSTKERAEKEPELPPKTDIYETLPNKEGAPEKHKTEKVKISLDELDEKLNKILEEEI